MKPKLITWWLVQWNDIKGNVKYGLILLAGAGMIALTRGLQWWQQAGLMVIFLGLVIWAVSAIIRAHNAEELVRNAPARAPAPKQPVPKMQIEVVSVRNTFINHGDHCTWTECDHGFQAILMSFKNQIATGTGEKNITFNDVTANLTYSRTGTSEHIDYGNWLDEYTRSVQFKPGEVRHLVVAWFERGRKRLRGLYNPKSTNPLKGRWHSNIELHEAQTVVLPESPCEVTVMLLSNNTTLFSGRYLLTATDDGTMELEIQ